MSRFTEICIPWFEPGVEYCILRINRTFDGTFHGEERAQSYRCRGGEETASRFDAKVTLKVTGDAGCDESSPIFPDGLTTVLTAHGTTVLRSDGFAHFAGTFTLGELVPAVDYFTGVIELIGQTGSHQQYEPCNARSHVEGWLVGLGTGPAAGYSLRALLVAKGELRQGFDTFGDTSINRLTGTLFRT